jgi:RNA polymerase sigma-70 factor, ECF subfamily
VDLDHAYRSLQTSLLGYLRVVAGDMAQDVASQVWVELASAGDAVPTDDAELRRLAFTIARRRAIDQRRRWWQRAVRLRSPGSPELEPPPAAGEPTPGPDLESALALLRRLPRAQAEVVLLRVLAGFSADEVAELTGRSAGSVRVIQHRALERLARELKEV